MYKIRLPNFEGPFDLLLFFIKRDELNIYDIPIAKITKEFLKYVQLMKLFDLELAGEFLIMASNLMFIKTQMLLPRPKDEEGQEIDDPRSLLVQRLIEYKQFKDASATMRDMSEEQRYTFYRRLFATDSRLKEDSLEPDYKNATLFDLMKAFNKLVDRAKAENNEHVVDLFPVTVDEKRDELISMLRAQKRISFIGMNKGLPVQHIVVSFLAVLELLKLRKIMIVQDDNFEDITIAMKPEMSMAGSEI